MDTLSPLDGVVVAISLNRHGINRRGATTAIIPGLLHLVVHHELDPVRLQTSCDVLDHGVHGTGDNVFSLYNF